jgi:hypothetical protein
MAVEHSGREATIAPEQGLDVDRGFTVELLGRCLCSCRIGIGHDDLLDAVQTLESSGVEYPDPTYSNEANAHAPTLPTMDSDGARQRTRIR